MQDCHISARGLGRALKYAGLFLATLACTGAVSPLLCQQEPDPPLAQDPELAFDPQEGDLLDEGDLMVFEEIPIVFSASKFEQSISEAPASVTVITAEEIRRYGYQTLAEILESVRGFYGRDDREFLTIGTRGFGRPGDYNSRFLLLIDNHRLNDNVYDSGVIGRTFPVDVDLIERVEVVRGPSSSLYGSNGFFGVINVITKTPEAVDALEVAAGYGTFDSWTGRLTYGKKFDDFGLLLSGSFFRTDGEQNIFYPEYDDPATNNGIAEDVDGEEATHLSGALEYGDFTLRGAYANREKTIPTGSYGVEFNDPRNGTVERVYYLDLEYQTIFGDDYEFLGRVFWDRATYDGDFVYDWGTPGAPDLVVNKDYSRSKWFGAEVQVTKTFGVHRVTAGVEWRHNSQQDQGNYDRFVYLDDRRDSYTVGVYAQDEIRIRDNLIVNAGLRWDYYASFDNPINPRVAVIWGPWEPTTLKFIYGTAFRAPNAFELYYNDGVSSQANPNLDPETIDTYEAVLEQVLASQVHGSVSVFYYEIDDLISQITDPNTGLLVFENVDEVVAHGVELELESRWPEPVHTRISYSYHRAEDAATHQRLTNAPEHLVRLNVDAEMVPSVLFGGLEVQYTDDRKTTQGTTADSYLITNLTLVAQDTDRRMQLRVGAKNLFDERVEYVAGDEHLQDVLVGRGRVLWIDVLFRF